MLIFTKSNKKIIFFGQKFCCLVKKLYLCNENVQFALHEMKIN